MDPAAAVSPESFSLVHQIAHADWIVKLVMAGLADAGPGHQHEDPVLPEWGALRQLTTSSDDSEDQNGRHNGAEDRQEG